MLAPRSLRSQKPHIREETFLEEREHHTRERASFERKRESIIRERERQSETQRESDIIREREGESSFERE